VGQPPQALSRALTSQIIGSRNLGETDTYKWYKISGTQSKFKKIFVLKSTPQNGDKFCPPSGLSIDDKDQIKFLVGTQRDITKEK
jgi:hypothetical protein